MWPCTLSDRRKTKSSDAQSSVGVGSLVSLSFYVTGHTCMQGNPEISQALFRNKSDTVWELPSDTMELDPIWTHPLIDTDSQTISVLSFPSTLGLRDKSGGLLVLTCVRTVVGDRLVNKYTVWCYKNATIVGMGAVLFWIFTKWYVIGTSRS